MLKGAAAAFGVAVTHCAHCRWLSSVAKMDGRAPSKQVSDYYRITWPKLSYGVKGSLPPHPPPNPCRRRRRRRRPRAQAQGTTLPLSPVVPRSPKGTRLSQPFTRQRSLDSTMSPRIPASPNVHPWLQYEVRALASRGPRVLFHRKERPRAEHLIGSVIFSAVIAVQRERNLAKRPGRAGVARDTLTRPVLKYSEYCSRV